MTDLLDSDNIDMHFLMNFIIYLRAYIWAECELLCFHTHLISALVFRDLRVMLDLQSQMQHFSGFFHRWFEVEFSNGLHRTGFDLIQ